MKLPSGANDDQIFEQLLKGGHIVRRHQRGSYSFRRHEYGAIDVLFHGAQEYLLAKSELDL